MHRRLRIPLLSLTFCVAGVSLASADVVINEIMYNSAGVDSEYVEIVNAGTGSMDVSGWMLKDSDDGHIFPVPAGTTLEPGEFLVFCGDTAAIKAKYGDIPVVGNLSFNFGNSGDQVRLFDSGFSLRDIVAYDDAPPWPPEADGDGPSLELVSPHLDNNLPTSWAASTNGYPHGTPGAENSVYTADQPPLISEVARNIPLPTHDDAVTVTARVSDDRSLIDVSLFVDEGGGFVAHAMADDGLSGDGAADDSTYGATIASQATETFVRYYVSATDNFGQTTTDPSNAPSDYYAYTVDYLPPDIVIHEVLAVNQSGAMDEMAEFEDWIELRNSGDETVNLGGMFLSDDFGASRQWEFPNTILGPGEFLIVWADDEVAEGPLHASFKLSSLGESAAIFETVDHGNVMIDGFTFGLQSPDVSFGYLPEDGTAPEYLNDPTPGASNATSTLYSKVCINEFMTTSVAGGTDDWVELMNRGAGPIDISGWHISDDVTDPLKYAIPSGTILYPGMYYVVTEDSLGFGFASDGSEAIMLTNADGVTGQDYYDHGPQTPDISEGRTPNGMAYWHFFWPSTPGAPNGDPIAVDEPETVAPSAFHLGAGRPNPFFRATRISFDLPHATSVKVAVFDVAGRLVRVLEHGALAPGSYVVPWDGRDTAGRNVGSGRYFVRVETPERSVTTSVVRLR